LIEPRIHSYGTVESTNDIATEMLRRGEPEGTVVTALSQSKGRGRRGRGWFDEPGDCALMSMIFTPNVHISRMHEMSFVVSLGVADFLSLDHGLNPALKWPNDVLIDDKKIVGILVETVDKLGAVAGIGLNVNQVELPDEIKNSATSLKIITGKSFDVDTQVRKLSERILKVYEEYLAVGFDYTLTRWREFMWGVGRRVEISTSEQLLTGTIDGVDSSGALIIKDACGKIQTIVAADAIKLRQKE
jgi:BirA family biotin operon repressor/biotin-[acetyl-CoA-carboxylase] ligase